MTLKLTLGSFLFQCCVVLRAFVLFCFPCLPMTWIIKVFGYSACSRESSKVGTPVGLSCSSEMVGPCREQSRGRGLIDDVASKSGKPPNQCSREDKQAVPFSELTGPSVLRDCIHLNSQDTVFCLRQD